MNLVQKKIALAVCTALASTAASAYNLISDQSVSPDNIFWISGATAQTPQIAKAVQNLCKNTIDTYVDGDSAAAAGTVSFIYYCSASNNASIGVDTKFVVVKNENGSAGAIDAARSVTESSVSTKGWADPTNITLTTTVPTTANTNDIIGNFKGTAAMKAGTVTPQLGFSDVNNNIWKARGTTVANAYTSKIISGQGFGVAVSDRLYHLMQYDQKLLPWQQGVGVTLNANQSQPNITKDQYAQLLASPSDDLLLYQKLLPRIVAESATSTYVASSDTYGNIATSTVINATNLPDVLQIVRRSGTSGTTAATEAYFLNNPCSTSQSARGVIFSNSVTQTSATGTDTTLSTGSYGGKSKANDTSIIVTTGGSTGEVLDVLKNTTNPTSNNNLYSIGVISLENPAVANNDSSVADWKYLKLNGVSPNFLPDGTADTYQKTALINGTYTFQYESEMMYPSTPDPKAAGFITALINDLKVHSNLATSHGVFGVGGFTGAVTSSGQTNHWGRSGNQCDSLKYVW